MLLLANLAFAVPVKNVGHFEGRQSNTIEGVGLVTGLRGTGDSIRMTATMEAIAEQLRDKGTPITSDDLISRNAALVLVRASVPPGAKAETELDITVSAVGDAKSLEGGMLMSTYLTGPDPNIIYASASCSGLIIGGFTATGGGDSSRKNHPTVGTCSNGAVLDQAIPTLDYRDQEIITYLLDTPSFGTAVNLADAINDYATQEIAFVVDDWSVDIYVPEDMQGPPVNRLLGEIERLDISVELPARVVVSERTGTVVMGADVTISPVAISHGGLTIEVDTDLQVSQPNILTGGNTAVVQTGNIAVGETGGQITMVEGTSVGDLVTALNAMGVKPRDLVTILSAMSAAGALNAELVVQ